MPHICCDRFLCCFGATPCEWETGLVSRHVCMKYWCPPASWLPAASAQALGNSSGSRCELFARSAHRLEPPRFQLGLHKASGSFSWGLHGGYQPNPMGQAVLWWKGAGLPWHTHLPEGESAFQSPSSLGLTGWSHRFPGPGDTDGHRQGRIASNSTLPRGTRHLSPHPIDLLHREHPWSHSSDQNDGTGLFHFSPSHSQPEPRGLFNLTAE